MSRGMPEEWRSGSHDQLCENNIKQMVANWKIVYLYFFKIYLLIFEQIVDLDYLFYLD